MKPMATAKKRSKGHALIAATKAAKANEPIVTQENYNSELNTALTWYTEHYNEKQLLKFALEYFVALGDKKAVVAINKATDFEVRQLGIICRLASREQYLEDKHKTFITDTAQNLISKYSKEKVVKTVDAKPEAPVVSIQERIEEKARDLAGEIEGAIDEFVTNKKSDFSAKNYLLAQAASGPVAKRIGEFYVKLYNEIADAINEEDEQLIEGYSHFNKRQLKAFHKFVGDIIDDCEQMVQTAKATRAPRKRKAVSPSKVVSKMKYMKEFAELNLKSCKPEDILSATELWVYNTKYRKVQVYKADIGTLSVKGTTILGFSIKDSTSLTLRKPEEFFKGLSMGKRALNAAIKKITTKPTTPNGRVNEECVLLGAF
jgi:hypothetical protein